MIQTTAKFSTCGATSEDTQILGTDGQPARCVQCMLKPAPAAEKPKPAASAAIEAWKQQTFRRLRLAGGVLLRDERGAVIVLQDPCNNGDGGVVTTWRRLRGRTWECFSMGRARYAHGIARFHLLTTGVIPDKVVAKGLTWPEYQKLYER